MHAHVHCTMYHVQVCSLAVIRIIIISRAYVHVVTTCEKCSSWLSYLQSVYFTFPRLAPSNSLQLVPLGNVSGGVVTFPSTKLQSLNLHKEENPINNPLIKEHVYNIPS